MMRFVLALLNLFGFPGLGTYLAGYRRTGIIQACISLCCSLIAITSMAWVSPTVYAMYHDQEASQSRIADGDFSQLISLLAPVAIASVSLLVFACNWLWSSTTTKPLRHEPPPIPGRPQR
jgi:TRAP-type C4-dicarboxylate transport system permease small subunit